MQCFQLLDLRRPHISASITHEQVADAFARRDLDTLVVYPNFFVCDQIVPHHHFLLPADQRRSDLHRRQPIYVDVRDDVFRKIHRQIRHIFNAVQMLFAGGHNRFWLSLNQVVHNRQIVGRKVPDNADVVLKQSQIYAKRIVIIEVA